MQLYEGVYYLRLFFKYVHVSTNYTIVTAQMLSLQLELYYNVRN